MDWRPLPPPLARATVHISPSRLATGRTVTQHGPDAAAAMSPVHTARMRCSYLSQRRIGAALQHMAQAAGAQVRAQILLPPPISTDPVEMGSVSMLGDQQDRNASTAQVLRTSVAAGAANRHCHHRTKATRPSRSRHTVQWHHSCHHAGGSSTHCDLHCERRPSALCPSRLCETHRFRGLRKGYS